MSDKSEFPDMDTGYVDSMNADRDIIAAECQRLRDENITLCQSINEARRQLALSTVNGERLERENAQLRAEVERLTHDDSALFRMTQERDQWREVAIQLSESLPKESWRRSVTQDNALAAYERLCSQQTTNQRKET